jgi:hypothetical protein
MKTKINLMLLSGLLALAAIFSGCTPCDDPTDPECPNYDPCHGEVWEEPEIVIKEMLFSKEDTFYHAVTDTVLPDYDLVSFSVNGNFDSYTWQIGSDPRTWEQDEVRLRFQNAQGKVPVSVIVERSPNPCFPDKPVVDTLSTTLTVMPSLYDSKILGKYFGQVEGSPEDTFTVSVWIDTTSTPGLTRSRVSVPGICDKNEWYDGAANIGYISASLEALYNYIGGCTPFEAMLRLEPNDPNKIRMQYRYTPSGDPDDLPDPVQTFVGTRIQ